MMLQIVEPGSYQINSPEVNIAASGEVILYLCQDCVITQRQKKELKLHLINEKARRVSLKCVVADYLTVTLAALNSNPWNFEFQALLEKSEARVKMVAATISKHTCDISFQVEHLATATYSEIANYAVCLADSEYNCLVKARVNKGCKNSEAWQNSRVLTKGNIDKIKILPVLEMAENEIKAKHSCSIGRLSEEQQYYLASFGLDDIQISQLIAKGYLSNILQEMDDRQVQETLERQIVEKVRDLCLT